MQVLHPICCGIDSHPTQRTAGLRWVSDDGHVTTELRDWGTTYGDLVALRPWLEDQGCPVVVLESPGVYWQPIDHVLVETREVLLANAHAGRQRPGRKTEKAEARWLTARVAHGLIEPRFIPPPIMRALRDLTRTRVALVETRTQATNRVIKIREDTNSKVAHVVSDLLGTSGRRMLAALIAGERHPQKWAARALGKLRRKLPARALALTGQCTEHHGRIMQGTLELMDRLDRQIADLDTQMREASAPCTAQLEPLRSMPGVNETTAYAIIAEIGTDRQRFGSAARVASWAGLCPGHHASAGKRRRGRTRKGNRYLRRVVVQCAWAARKTPTFLGRTFRRLAVRLGKKKAAVAMAHKILVISYHLLLEGTWYDETRYDCLAPKQEARERQRAVKALERLGYSVTLDKVASGERLQLSRALRGGLCLTWKKGTAPCTGEVCQNGPKNFVGICIFPIPAAPVP
jgi:transposase